MDKVDQFASRFKSASKVRYRHQEVPLRDILVVTDLSGERAQQFLTAVRSYLFGLSGNVSFSLLERSDFDRIGDLLAVVAGRKPDLICTYRHLGGSSERWPTTLGSAVEVLTQETTYPVLLVPHPEAEDFHGFAERRPRSVMVITDHLAGEGALINHALALLEGRGTLHLAHVEDDAVFARYLDAISKIPALDTELVRQSLDAQLLKEPRDYIQSCREVLKDRGMGLTLDEVVVRGHLLATYRRLVAERSVDLLVMQTKDHDQLAMHGLAYPLAVELRATPLLML